jgi:hypothetical protein
MEQMIHFGEEPLNSVMVGWRHFKDTFQVNIYMDL